MLSWRRRTRIPRPKRRSPWAKKDENHAPEKKKPIASDELVQEGAVKVEDASSTTVFYPIPFASSPHLILTTKLGGRKFVINRQDELGFTWSLALTEAEVKSLDDLTKIGNGKPPDQKPPDAKSTPEKEEKPAAEKKLNSGPHEFAWEARGVREKVASPVLTPLIPIAVFRDSTFLTAGLGK